MTDRELPVFGATVANTGRHLRDIANWKARIYCGPHGRRGKRLVALVASDGALIGDRDIEVPRPDRAADDSERDPLFTMCAVCSNSKGAWLLDPQLTAEVVSAKRCSGNGTHQPHDVRLSEVPAHCLGTRLYK